MSSQPKRRFAQHFLETSWAERVVRIIAPKTTDTIIEVGPGRGSLTRTLARSGATLVAVEIDHDLVTQLRARAMPNLTVVPGDFLTLDLESLPADLQEARIVGNLPYSVASQILVKLLWASGRGQRFQDAVLMFQREVAHRVTAGPGSRNWGPLAILTRLHAEPTRVLTLPPGAFRPMPAVTSVVVALRFRPTPVTISDARFFDAMVRVMFTQRRKTALNALRAYVTRESHLTPEQVFERAGINPTLRPTALGLSELADLSEVLRSTRR